MFSVGVLIFYLETGFGTCRCGWTKFRSWYTILLITRTWIVRGFLFIFKRL